MEPLWRRSFEWSTLLSKLIHRSSTRKLPLAMEQLCCLTLKIARAVRSSSMVAFAWLQGDTGRKWWGVQDPIDIQWYDGHTYTHHRRGRERHMTTTYFVNCIQHTIVVSSIYASTLSSSLLPIYASSPALPILRILPRKTRVGKLAREIHS